MSGYTIRETFDADGSVVTIGDFGASYGDDIAMCLYKTMTVLLLHLGEQIDPATLKSISNPNPTWGVEAERETMQTIADIYDLQINVFTENQGRMNQIDVVRGTGKHLRPVPVFWYPGVHFANVFYFEDPAHRQRILDEHASHLNKPNQQILDDFCMACKLATENN